MALPLTFVVRLAYSDVIYRAADLRRWRRWNELNYKPCILSPSTYFYFKSRTIPTIGNTDNADANDFTMSISSTLVKSSLIIFEDRTWGAPLVNKFFMPQDPSVA
jgi:hypothetical protein